jgi:dihydroorotate dehydrogenase (fumarate)
MEDGGAGAVVLFSLFEEQIRRESLDYEKVLGATSNTFAEAMSYFPDIDEYRVGSASYLEIIRQAKERVKIPIIGSLNGITPEGWIEYGRQMEQAGADAIEINVFFIPVDLSMTGADVEQLYVDIVKQLKSQVKIPIAIKLNPYFSSMANMALRFQEAGVDGLVLFNRFYQPDFDIEILKVKSSLEFSTANEIRLPLLWIGALYGRLNLSLAATTGVQTATEVIKYLLAGSDVAMTASSLYKHSIGYLHTIHKELMQWMSRHQFTSIDQFRGVMSQQNISDPTAYERANYIRILETNGRG